MAKQTTSQDSVLKSTTDPKLHLKKVDLENIDYENLAKIKETSKPETKKEDPSESQEEQAPDISEAKKVGGMDLRPKKPNSKNNLWLVVLIVLVVFSLIFAGFSFFNRNSNNNDSANNTNSGLTTSAFTLIKEFGEVSYKEADEYVVLNSDEKELKNSSFIKVGNGQAHVLFANNSLLSIDSNSEVQINYENGDTDINQLAGNTWNRVKKLTSNESYTVTTPTALATVRGTKFGVELAKDPATLAGFYTIEGRVNVSQFGENKKILTNDEITSPQFVEVKKEGQPEAINKGNLLAEENQGRWYSRNRQIDKLYDAVEEMQVPDFLKNIRESKDLQKILLENKGNTKKENCLELLDPSKVIKKEAGFIKIAAPANNAEFKTTDTIQFSTEGLNPCTQNDFDEKEVKWFLNGKAVEFAIGLTAEQKNLEVGDYTVTVKTLVAGKEFSDTINFKVINASSSSSKSSSSSSKKSSSSVAVNQAPTVVINSPANGSNVIASTFVSSSGSDFIWKGAVTLSVSATDPEDGALTGTKITWSMVSSFGSTSGNGSNFTGYCYSDGSSSVPCTVTVTATDSKGLSGSKTIVLNVVPN